MMNSVGAAAFFRALKGATEQPSPRSAKVQDTLRRRFWTGETLAVPRQAPPIRTAGSATVTESGILID